MQNFFEELKWRGFLHTSSQGAEEHLAAGPVTAYIGFDPTAPSLHVGSLLPMMGLVHFQRAGHLPIAVTGGGTGMIGDPSGKTQERKLLSVEDIGSNLEGIKRQLSMVLDFGSKTNPARMVNNAEWLTKLTMMQFLRDIGKHFSVNEMLAKESVKSRIGQEHGMSFTEFSYSLLQAYDYLELFDRYKCTLQMGGSDQWGNIVGGIDLIRRLRGKEVHGIVFPLIATASGVKFGKTESGTVWLDPERTSPYRFYQFWFNTDDRDVVKYLKFFTLLPRETITGLGESLASAPEKREAQTALAREVTKLIHGESALDSAVRASKVFFGGEVTGISAGDLLDIFSDVPSCEVAAGRLKDAGIPLPELMVTAGAATSKGDARRTIQGGGLYLNNRRVTEEAKIVTIADAVEGKFIILRKGSRNYFLVRAN